MKILVYPHSMVMGGTVNAIELAAAVQDRGHEVALLSRPGPLVEAVRQLGVEHIPLTPRARRVPAPQAVAQLLRLTRRRGIDVIHGYEWPPAVEAFAGPRLLLGLPVVSTINAMMVAPFLPRTIPLIVGTEEIAERAAEAGHASVTLIEPPVDVNANAPGFDAGSFRTDHGFDAAPLLVVVCRLAHQLKLEGLCSACDAVGRLAASGVKVQLAVVGDGPARAEVERAAMAANARAGRRAVVLTGEMYDPRPAYAAADIVLGMGGSALRGMAFGKPLVVQGERGFWELLTPESAPVFLRQGWYGIGSSPAGVQMGAARLEHILRGLADDVEVRVRLGEFGRKLILERFSLGRAAGLAEEVYAHAMEGPPRSPAGRLVTDAARTGMGVLRHQGGRKWRRWRGKPVAADDMNTVAHNLPGATAK